MEEILYSEGCVALIQVAQRSCDCPLPGTIQGQVGRTVQGLGAPWAGGRGPCPWQGVGTR